MGVGIVRRVADPVGLKNSGGSPIDPATEGTLAAVLAAVDGLELSVDNIDIDLDAIGDTTDVEATGNGTLIAITKRLRTLLGNLDGKDYATETTLAAFKSEQKTEADETQAKLDTLDTSVNTLLKEATFAAEDFASETTLAAVNTAIGTKGDAAGFGDASVIAALKAIRDTSLLIDAQQTDGTQKTQIWDSNSGPADVDATDNDARAKTKSSLATFAHLYGFDEGGDQWARMRGTVANGLEVDVTRSALPSGAATEATLGTLLTEATFAAEDFASETTLALIHTILNDVWNNAGDRLRVEVDAIDVEVNSGPDEPDDDSVAGGSTDTPRRLNLNYAWNPTGAVWKRLDAEGPIATEAKQDSIVTELQSANTSLDAIESDADAIRIAAQSIDTDFDVALSTRASEATLSNLDTTIGDETDVEATGDGTVVAILKRLRTLLGTIDTNTDGIEGQLTNIETNQTDGTQKTQIVDSTGDIADVVPSIIDGLGDGKSLRTAGHNYVWNGAEWWRMKDVANGDNLTSGLPAAGLYGFDGAAFDRVRLASPSGGGIGIIGVFGAAPYLWSENDNEYSRPTRDARSIGDGRNGQGFPPTSLMGWNGATFDRLRSSIANGLEVDVTRLKVNGSEVSETNPLFFKSSVNRTEITGLSFSETLTALGTHTTSWVDISNTNWLSIATKLETNSAVDTTIEFTNAADPNTTPPGVDDVVRTIPEATPLRLGGAGVGGIDNPSFSIPAQLQWARITVTDVTGGQDIDVTVFDHDMPQGGAHVPLATTLKKDFVAPLTQAAIRGELKDDAGVRTGDYDTVPLTATGSLQVADSPDVLASDSTEESGALPSGSLPTFDPVGPIVAANVIDTGWINVSQWDYQFFHAMFGLEGVKVFLMDASDDQGNNSVTTSFAFPTATSGAAGTSINIGAPFFQSYFRIVIINDSGSSATNWAFRSIGLHHAIGEVFFPIDQPLLGFIPAPVIQSIQKGQRPDDTFGAERISGFDSTNSSTTPLPSNDVFVGTLRSTEGYEHIGCVVNSDQNSAVDGWKVQFTNDSGTAFTADNTTDTITSTGHGLSNDETIYLFTDGTMPGGLNEKTEYYVINASANDFQLSLTEGGAPIDITDNGTGTHHWISIVREIRTTYTDGDVTSRRGVSISVPTQGTYVRVIYVNGAVGQNFFSIQTQLDTQPQSAPLRPIKHNTEDVEIGALSLAHLKVWDEAAGEWNSVRGGETDKNAVAVSVGEIEADVPIKALPDWKTGQVTVNTTAPVQIAGTALDERKTIVFKNNGTNEADVFIGPTGSVTENNGFPVGQFESIEIEITPNAQLWAILSSAASGSTNLQTISANATNSSSGVTSPDNVFSSNDVDATFAGGTATAEYAIADFTFSGAFDSIQKVQICFEGAKVAGSGNKTIGHEETVTNTRTGGTSITTTGTLSAVSGDQYIAAIAMRDDTESVSSVSGLGLTWALQIASNRAGEGRVEIWTSSGNPTSSGQVTANFATAVTSAAISASRYSGVETVQATGSNNGTTAGWSVTPGSSEAGDVIYAAAALFDTVSSNSPGAPDVERSDVSQSGSENERLTFTTQDRQVSGTNVTVDGTWAAADKWAAAAITLDPEPLDDPTIRLEYEVNAEGIGPTSGTKLLTSTTDSTFKVDVTADRAWADSDLDGIKVTVSMENAGTLNAAIDHVFVEVTETAATATQRCAFLEVGGS